MTGTLDRYLGARVLIGLAIALLGLMAVFSLIRFGQELRDVGTGGYGVFAATRFVLHTLPAEAVRLLTPAVLVGTAYALGDLAAHNETIALFASGFSRARLLSSVLQVVGLVSVLGLGFADFVAAPLAQRAHFDRSVLLSSGQAVATAKGLWARDGNRFVNIRRADAVDQLSGIYVYEMDAERRLRAFRQARNAVWSDGRWELRDVVESTLGPDGLTTRRESSQAWSTTLAPSQIALLEVPVEELSTASLLEAIRSLRARGESAHSQIAALWSRLAAPIAAAAMATLAVAFFSRPRGRMRSGPRVAAAALAGIAFQLADEMFGRAALLDGWPAPVASLALPTVVLASGLVWLADPAWRARLWVRRCSLASL